MDLETKEFNKEEIGELATLVARGFEHNDQKFAELKGEITELRTDVTGLRTEMEELHDKVDVLDDKVDTLDDKVNTLDSKVTRIDFRTQNQVDSVYEDTTLLKKDMKQAKGDIVALKAHVGLSA